MAGKPVITLLVEKTQCHSLKTHSQVPQENKTNEFQRNKNKRNKSINTEYSSLAASHEPLIEARTLEFSNS